MTDTKEGQPSPLPENSVQERSKLQIWKDIIYKQAYDLLGKYLPEAQPQEPTDVWMSAFPGYQAKYRGKHYVAGENPILFEDSQRHRERFKHPIDWEGPLPGYEDWDEPEKLLEGIQQYSINSLKGVYTLVHELIHQRQAELYPDSFPVLTSEDVPNEQLVEKMMDAHKAWSRSRGHTLFEPVVEGMAVLGTYYVMGRLLEDLIKMGDIEGADKVKSIRNEAIRGDISLKQPITPDSNPHDPYREGLRMMRKLYKKFGIENAPRIFSSIDLKACQNIKQDTPEYQQIMENPELLPGLKVA